MSEPKPKAERKRSVWPTLWHRAQLAFPWGSSKRPPKRPPPEIKQEQRKHE